MQIEVRKAEMGKEKKRLKVCAYARVSTEASEQENSLENQVSHYTEMIQANPAYEFAGVYADFGISGFKESRPQFLKMMQDAKNGKIDLIITKSVSRFARNTAIVLKASRELKDTETAELTATVIAQDGIAVVVNNNNPIDNLTKDQVKSIYVGETTSWSEVE